VTEFLQPPVAVPTDAPPTVLPDLNLHVSEVKEEKRTRRRRSPSPEARVLLRRFASAMAVRPAGIRVGTWWPEAIGLTGLAAELRLNEAAPHLPSSSA
jgi:hypothetical protein